MGDVARASEEVARVTSGSWPEIAADVLRIDSAAVGTRGFIALGGTSIRAIEFAARVEADLGLVVDVNRVLGDAPLGEVLANAVPRPASAPVRAVAGVGGAPLLSGQRGMIATEMLHGGKGFHLVFSARIRGHLNTVRLDASLDAMIERHESLRTVFERGPDGVRRHVLSTHRAVVVRQRGLHLDPADPVGTLHRHIAGTTHHFIDPFGQPPVVFVLTPLGPDDHVLTLVVHHAIIDGWSIGILFREIFQSYEGKPLAPAPSAELLLDAEEAAVRRGRVDELIRVLDLGGDEVVFPVDGGQAFAEDGRGETYGFDLPEEARRASELLAAELSITRNAVLFGAWAFVLGRYVRRDSVLVGVPVAGRGPGTRDVVGLATKLVPARVDIANTPAAYLRGAARALRAAVAFDDVPLELVAARVDPGAASRRNSVVQVGFAAQDDLVPDRFEAGGLAIELHEGHSGGSTFDATLVVHGPRRSGELAIEYATAKLTPATVAALAESLSTVITQFEAGIDEPLREVDALSAGQRAALISVGASRPVSWTDGLWAGIEATARRTPKTVAVRADRDELSYGELVDMATRTSAALAEAGVGPGDRVVVSVPRSVWEITAVLGVLRLGAVYASINADVPAALATRMLATLNPSAVVTLGPDERWRALAPGHPAVDARVAAFSDALPVPSATDQDRPVYISFTSGSTGLPKGVRVSERAVLRLVHGADYAGPESAGAFARIAPLAFDASTFEIFYPLTHGGRVEVFGAEVPTPATIAGFLTGQGVLGAFLTTTLFRLVVDHSPSAFDEMALVITGGEVTPSRHVRAALRGRSKLRVVHAYGPTENTTFTTVEPYDEAGAVPARMPIGTAVAGTGLVVLDAEGRLTPPGAIGELHVYGPGLAIDYDGDAEATAAAFGDFCAHLPHRLYRTGDLVRWDARGWLEFIGRLDRQVKVRGFRVELDGVQQCLSAHPAVADAAVFSTADGTDLRLGAALVLRPGGVAADVRAHAARELPAFSVPVLWTVVDRFPLTANGKLDVPALLRLDPSDSTPESGSTSELDLGELEELVARAWQAALGTDDFGYDDAFFDVGGDSLLMTTVRDHIRSELPELKLTVLQLFSHPTVAELAAFLHEMGEDR